MEYFLGPLKKYAMFEGRASRKEYWMFTLFNIIIFAILSTIDGFIGSNVSILTTLYSLAVLIPSLALAVRRLHDTNHSGWWLLIGLIPVIGAIVLFVFMVTGSNPAKNQYGASTKM